MACSLRSYHFNTPSTWSEWCTKSVYGILDHRRSVQDEHHLKRLRASLCSASIQPRPACLDPSIALTTRGPVPLTLFQTCQAQRGLVRFPLVRSLTDSTTLSRPHATYLGDDMENRMDNIDHAWKRAPGSYENMPEPRYDLKP